MAKRDIYNTIDCKERLLLIGIEKDKYGGYKQDFLEKDLGETEVDFYVCVKCNGLMRNACLVNEPDPILVCEVCKTGEDFMPMVKARKNISRLRAKCPLKKRGCVWKGSLGEINAHLNECAEFILNCSKGCGVLLKRSELQNHCENECQLRIVKCKYCGATIQYKVLDNHNRICLEFLLVCPNECLKSLIRKELESHIEKECPNTLIACPYKELGCEVLSKRSELSEHQKTFESKHLDQTEVFYFNKVKKMESIIQEKEEDIKQLTAEVRNLEKECQRSKNSNLPVLALITPRIEFDELTERAKLLDHFYPAEESAKTRKHNSESITYETKDAAAGSRKRQKQSVDCKDNITENMCVIGLYNLGNTGYFNSVLQNLLYLRPFRKQLSHTMTRTKYKLVPKKHPELKTIEFGSDKKAEPGKLTIGLFELIKETITEQSSRTIVTYNIFTPWAVQNEIAEKSGRFSGGSQQDSHELFRFLIDMVKEEERQRLKTAFFSTYFDINGNYTKFNNCSDFDSKKLLEKYSLEFENCFVFNGTLIDDTFGGNMNSSVECLKCWEIISLNEVFLDISLPLEGTIEHENNSLESYLKHFFSPKFLAKNYVCNNCNSQLVSKQDKESHTNTKSNEDKHEMKANSESIDLTTLEFTDANKQFWINSLTSVLTIHLKRFYQSEFGLRKVNKHVEFPLVLDMSPFCASDTSVLKDCGGKILYGLRGIVEHSGGMYGGHYVAYVNIADWNVPSKIPREDIAKSSIAKDIFGKRTSTIPLLATTSAQKNGNNLVSLASENNVSPPPLQPSEEWYYISDSHISKTDHDHLFSSQAYILFYERLPFVTRDKVEGIAKNKTISEPATYERRDVANKIHDRRKPSFPQSYFIEKKTPVDYKGGLIKGMCVIGLSNLGNSCFLNSVLQNLLYLRPFRNQLTYTMDCTEYKLVQKKHPNLETETFSNSGRITEPGKLTRELFKLIQEATNEKPSEKNVIPKVTTSCAVKNEIAGKSGKFCNGSQQDNDKLFSSLMNMVRDEEIKRLKAAFWKYFDIKDDKAPFKNCSGDKKYLRKYASEFENSYVFNGTFIDDTFSGKMISKANCSVCSGKIDIFEDFLDISLPLPTYIKDNKNCSQEDYIPCYNQSQRKIESNTETEGAVESKESFLEYYLMQFFSPKLLEKDYFCNNCNPQLVVKQEKPSYTHTDSHKGKSKNKHFKIKTLAPVLTIHLQRFYQSELGLQKVSRHVKFPLVLDMSLFCPSETSILKDCDGKILYGLRGIVDHTSGIIAGQCVAYVNLADWNVSSKIPSKDNTKSRTAEESNEGISLAYDPMDAVPAQQNEENKLPHALESNLCRHVEFTDEWYFISDSYCHETDRYHVLNSQAYMLFYERLPIVEGCTEL